MDKKKILIVSRDFYPELSPRSFRTTELAKEFGRQGHDVVVYISKKGVDYSDFENEHKIIVKDLGNLKWPGVKIGSNKIINIFQRVVTRLLQLLFEYPSMELMFSVKKALKNENGFDLLISVAVPYPIHWGTAWARTKNHEIAQTWVADCGDPYMGCKTDSFKKLFYFKYIEKWFCRKADFITIPVSTAIDGYYPEFHHKIRVIPQGFKFPDITDLDNFKINTIPTFAYAGGFIPGIRDPRLFLDYLTSLQQDFRFYIYTSNSAILLPYISKLNEKLIVLNYIPREQLLAKLFSMDFLVNFDNNVSVQTPSKLIDYGITKRPVLNIKNTIDENLISEFLTGNYSHSFEIENINQYRIENICDRFLSLA